MRACVRLLILGQGITNDKNREAAVPQQIEMGGRLQAAYYPVWRQNSGECEQ